MKLFRKVREKLVREGKLKRYLIYAIGEILLVMIGILLAMQVNNWNQNRINHKKEVKALSDLKNEFELNKQRIQAKQALRNSIIPITETYINSISSGNASYNSFKDFHGTEFMFGMTNPSNGVIDALISSGEISLISNDSLKYYLSDWKNQLENLNENELILWESGLGLIGSTSGSIPNPSQKWTDWNQQKLEEASSNLISNTQYRNNLTGFDGCNRIVISECESVIRVLSKISNILDQEIEKCR